MPVRLMSVLCLSCLLLAMSGCPAAGYPIALGIWLAQTVDVNDHVGFELLANGAVNSFFGKPFPVGAENIFGGTLSWQQSGNTFTMVQQYFEATYTIVATLQSSTYMTGTRTNAADPNNPKPFTASKAPSENVKPARIATDKAI